MSASVGFAATVTDNDSYSNLVRSQQWKNVMSEHLGFLVSSIIITLASLHGYSRIIYPNPSVKAL